MGEDTRAPISCCMIVRNESANIVRCLESVRPWVRQICVVDTGSTDGTPALAIPYVDHFESWTGCNGPDGLMEDFSAARTRSMALATEEWVLWLDGDDVLEGGEHLGAICGRRPPGSPACIFALPYDYDPTCQQYRERLMTPKSAFAWHGPVHECISLLAPGTFADVDDRVMVRHRRTGKAVYDPGRNLRILERLYAKEGESDARNVFYLGRELSYIPERKDEAISLLERYVDLSGWDEERSLAAMRLSELYVQHVPRRPKDVEMAIFWGQRAVGFTPEWGEPHFAVARAFSERAYTTGLIKDWQRCIHYAMAGLGCPPTKTVLFVNPVERAVDIHRYLNVALNRVGDVEGALRSVRQALEVAPGEPNLDFNRKIYENHLARERVASALAVMVTTGKLTPHMASTALACVDGRAESYVVDRPVGAAGEGAGLVEALAAQAQAAQGAAPGPNQKVASIGPYRRSKDYPRGLKNEDFPLAAVGPHPSAWMVPDRAVLDDPPVRMNDGQLLSLTLALWKEYVLHDEMLAAESLLSNAPYRVRHGVGVERALRLTRATMAWMDDLEEEQRTNAPADPTVECGVPLPGPLTGQLLGRMEIVRERLREGDRILDLGCSDGSIANRLALKGWPIVGVDLCETSIALARRKAEEFETGARFVCSKFSELSPQMIPWADLDEEPSFNVAMSTDVYEHLRDPVADLILPARLALGDTSGGRMVMCTPYGAWMRGQYVPWAHPWRWADEKGLAWNAGEKRAHLVAPTPWSVAAHFREGGWWVKDSFAQMCEVQDVPGQGNVVCEARLSPPWETVEGGVVKLLHDYDFRDRLSVVFSTGDAWQEWNPEIMRKQGIGGSETAVVEMAKRLAARGHSVRVYGSCGAHGEGVYDGVEYRTADKIILAAEEGGVDVLVAWRNIPLLASCPAKVKLLWVHDVYAMGGPDGLLLEADKVLALSEWHRGNICAHHGLVKEHVHVTRNGIDLARFETPPEWNGAGACDSCRGTRSVGHRENCTRAQRDPHKAIYSSSPDRGLESLLQMWPRIRKEVPDATLHVFYGTDLWKACAVNDPALQTRIHNLELDMRRLEKDGVVVRGRVDQRTLAREMLSAGVWAYPTWFHETSCITAMEAQAAGLRIVTSPIAALKETVRSGIFVEGDWLSADYQAEFTSFVVGAMRGPAWGDQSREEVMAEARERFSWDGVADEWLDLMRAEIERKRAQPLAPYSPARTFVREGREGRAT